MKIRRDKARGRWCVDSRSRGGGRREFFGSRAEAERRLAELESDASEAGELWASLSGVERRTLADLHHAASKAGVTLSQVWHEWRALKAGQGVEASQSPPLQDAVRQYVAAKAAAKLARRTVQKLDGTLGWLVASVGTVPVGLVTHEHCRALLKSKPAGSWNTISAALAAFFSWTVRQGWRPGNPMDRIERHRERQHTPEILTVAETKVALQWLAKERPRALAWFVLLVFCGLRPEEAEKTDWNAIRWADQAVVVEAQTSKTNRRRVVYSDPVAFDWLRAAQKIGSDLPVPHQFAKMTKRKLRAVFGWKKWPQDCTRHSTASYWLAKTSDVKLVSVMLGHSQAILHSRYKALVTRNQALAFFNLSPQSIINDNVSR